jgi:hypothetical protein
MNRPLPPGSVAALEQLGLELTRWAQTQRDSSLAEREQAVLRRVRAALPQWLGTVLHLSTRQLDAGLRRTAQRCPAGGTPGRRPRWRGRPVTTVCGPVSWERPWYVCRDCHQGWRPVAQTWGLAPRERLREGLQEWLARLGAAGDFAEAREWLERLTGLHVARETVRSHAERPGARLEQAQPAAITPIERSRERALPLDAAPGQLLVATEAVLVLYRKTGWQEVKLGLVAAWQDGARWLWPLAAEHFSARRELGDGSQASLSAPPAARPAPLPRRGGGGCGAPAATAAPTRPAGMIPPPRPPRSPAARAPWSRWPAISSHSASSAPAPAGPRPARRRS